jgi:2-C-methyl-D-erythritol 4-phosphate cytidylyltransferase
VGVVALIPAAGRGERAGGAVPKQLRLVAGRPLVAWAVARLRAAGIGSFVVAAPPEIVDAMRDGFADEPDLQIVAGGATRQESVANALAASGAKPDDLVAVHDAARPAVSPEDVAATLAAATKSGGAVLGRAVTDTVKRMQDGVIVGTVDRSSLFRAETPQVFRRQLLEEALARATADGFVGTDESSLVERLGVQVVAVDAKSPNPKVTFAEDLAVVESLLAPRGVVGARP